MLNLDPSTAPMNGKVTTFGFGFGKLWRRTAPWLLLVTLLIPPLFSELVLAIAPSLMTYVLYGATAAFLQVNSLKLPWKRQFIKILMLASALLVLHLVPWTSRKVFLAEFDRVENGMSVERVHWILAPVSLSPDHQTALTVRGYRHSNAP